jgi:hypothetical protein
MHISIRENRTNQDLETVCSPQGNRVLYLRPSLVMTSQLHAVTYDHRHLKTRDPVRSPIDKQVIARLVLGWVTTGESLVLYVLMFFVPFWPVPHRVINMAQVVEEVNFRSAWLGEQNYLETVRARFDVAGCGLDVKNEQIVELEENGGLFLFTP